MDLKHLAVFAAALLAPAGSAEAKSGLRPQFEARYAAFEAAVEMKDEAAIRSVLADGLIVVDVDGKSRDAAQMLKGLLAIPSDRNRQFQTTILSVLGDERVSVVKQRTVMTTKLEDTDGAEKSAAISTISTDNWSNENGSWRLTRTVMEQVDTTVDGKTVEHKTNSTAKQ